MMFEKILVALDRSSEAPAVFDFALSIAQPEVTEMLLVHFVDWQMQNVSPWVGVATLYDVDISGERYDWSRQHLHQEVENRKQWLATLTETAKQQQINCEYECQVGNCNLGIGDRAKNWGADLIVIGRRGHRNISEIFLGSVSNYVIHHAPCSILVVQGNEISEADDEMSDAVEVN
ncbi:MAG: universal stress protein [Pleurocapsa sp. MO_226.B13]|nr:universal stress protein [Pleurocapsa sp. MO_226.B13]